MIDENFPVVPSPTTGIDGRVSLATAIHAGPGVYAVLVGSGMSSAAGVPTGWQVVQDLIRKVALAEGVDPDEIGPEPEKWWVNQQRPAPRYDTLLGALATTDAARQSLLRRYFETGVDGFTPVEPTAGHHALAALAASGRVRVIVTTNFDRLIERALDQAGVAPQVISHPEVITGMTPLVHAPVTVIKLHGDYLSGGLRNIPEELGTYPDQVKDLLARIVDEYGLVVVGWSAEYDIALAEAIKASPSRRYPTYWATFHGHVTESARRIIAERQACVIDTGGADEFLEDLDQKLTRLDRIAHRRVQPTLLRTYYLMPDASNARPGWSVLPLLQLRSAATIGPASQETCGFLRAENRDALVAALRSSPLANRVRSLSLYPAASAKPDAAPSEETPSAPTLSDWEPSPGGHQSTDQCTYRLGGDASAGLSLVITVRLPGFGVGGQVVVTADTAVSLRDKLRLAEAALTLRDGLLLVTTTIPEALADILPSDAEPTSGEVHFVTSNMYGYMIEGYRPNDIVDRVDLSSLGTQTRVIGQHMGCAARLSNRLTEREASELVCDAIDYMAHAVGFLDPRMGIRVLRQELGLPNPIS